MEHIEQQRKVLTDGIYIVENFLPIELGQDIINRIETECVFEDFTINGKKLCRTGCFQGTQVNEGLSTFWLRCPSIEFKQVYPWSPVLDMIKVKIYNTTGFDTNIAKLQLYEDGNAHINIHSDKILDLDEETPIFVVRFGADRTCVLVNKVSGETIHAKVPHNSLLVISYEANLVWKHGIITEDDINTPSYSIVYRKSVTYKYDKYVYGERTPFQTLSELVSYIHSNDRDLWTHDTHKTHMKQCFIKENKQVCNLDLYESVIKYSPWAY